MALPALLAYAPAAVSAATSLAEYFGRKKRPKFKDTETARVLKRLSEQGVYSPAARGNLVGRMSGTLGNLANTRKTNLRGWLESRGMGKSIAGRSLIDSVDRDVMKRLSDYARDLDARNELSKANALREYAERAAAWNQRRREEESRARRELFRGLGNALAGGIGAYARGLAPDGIRIPENFTEMNAIELFKWARENDIPYEDAEALYFNTLADMEARGYGGGGYFFRGLQIPR